MDVLREYDLETDGYLLFIGRLSVLKGPQYLVKAFQRIRKDYPKLKLVIVGAGDFENRLRSITKGIGNVVFTGHISSPGIKKILFRNSLLIAVPSLYEALPMVILEAMACGKAIIASRVGDIPILVKHGKNGFLIDPRDDIALESYIRILCDNKKLRKEMGFFSRKLVEEEFNCMKMADRTLEVYSSLLCARSRESTIIR
jgi:glycosyltransferase involved in cell wall biosynthesis